MTKIDTIEDLVRIIEEHPGWLDRIRNLILTEELMRLPGRFDRFAEDFDQFANKTEGRLVSLEDGQERLERGQTQLEGGQERLERGQTQLEGGQERLERGQTQLEGGQERLERRQTQLERGQARLERGQARLVDDVGMLKGAHTSTVSERDYAVIALELGFNTAELVSRADMYRLGTSAAVGDMDRNVLRSFRAADLIIKAADDDGRTHYIAVEASFSINGRDTDRAMRNAEILTRVTGDPATAAVCGYVLDDTVREKVDSGAVHWYQLTHKDLAPR